MDSDLHTPKRAPSSQTLSRGLTALELLADADGPMSIAQLSMALGLHRSITYRIVRTLEDHGFVERNAGGGIEVGVRLAAVARAVARDLQSAALPELTAIANELGMTAFVATVAGAGSEVVTLASVEPRHAAAVVAQRPGSQHPIGRGAPGRAIARQLADPAQPGRAAQATPYETSHDEVIPGLSSIAVPLMVPGQPPTALAVVFLTRPVDELRIGARLIASATRIVDLLS